MILRFVGIACALIILNVACVRKDVPKERHLVDCNTNSLRFLFAVEEQPPYQLVIALPKVIPFDSEGRRVPTKLRLPKFQAEAVLTGASGSPLHIRFSSDQAKWCNWLKRDHGLEAFILCKLPLKKGEVYDVQISFSDAPPLGCSLWLSGMVRETIPL
jgi:hypothetical protein